MKEYGYTGYTWVYRVYRVYMGIQENGHSITVISKTRSIWRIKA